MSDVELSVGDGVLLNKECYGIAAGTILCIVEIDKESTMKYKAKAFNKDGTKTRGLWFHNEDLALDSEWYKKVFENYKMGDVIELFYPGHTSRYLITGRSMKNDFELLKLGSSTFQVAVCKMLMTGRSVRGYSYRLLTSNKICNMLDVMKDIPYDTVGGGM